ncbi:hypothetical protein [Streptomyces fagopyri]|uniref:hypothetical protein n=1 Tax=Streptomyces fagopyri TaxID=2662397 RepID=UPI001885A834|nr:hypothetical protein [Streptomyces fagopyri]
MKWILLGALAGLLLAYPSILALLIAVAAVLLSKPVAVAFGLGLLARPFLPRLRRRLR